MFVAKDKNFYISKYSTPNNFQLTTKIKEAQLFESCGFNSSIKFIPVKVQEYPQNEVIINRVVHLIESVFGQSVFTLHTGSYTDPAIETDNVMLYWNEHTRIIKEYADEPVLIPGYQLSTVSYDPGVMYHKDGSGTPPSCDYNDVGKPHKNLESAVKEMVKLIAEIRLCQILDSEVGFFDDD